MGRNRVLFVGFCRLELRFYASVSLFNGYAVHMRMSSTPSTNCVTLFNPIPQPACGAVSYCLYTSMYQSKSSIEPPFANSCLSIWDSSKRLSSLSALYSLDAAPTASPPKGRMRSALFTSCGFSSFSIMLKNFICFG